MKDIALFPELSRVRVYQWKVTLLLTLVPIACCIILTAFVYFFAQQNLFFLEAGGMLINDDIRQAYRDQIQLELGEVIWYLLATIGSSVPISFLFVGWAISPFTNAERLLRGSLANPDIPHRQTDAFSEAPAFHKVTWGLAQTLRDKSHPFDQFPPAKYYFNYRYFLKFVLGFYVLSVATGYVLGIEFDAMYQKIVSMAISLVRINRSGHFFLAQEELLHSAITMMVAIQCLAYWLIGYYVTRYMSNMTFVFTRAIREHHFPLRLRHSDVYHDLADTISEVANAAGVARK